MCYNYLCSKPHPFSLSGHSDRGCECRGRFICDRWEGGSLPCLSAAFEEGVESGRLGTGEVRYTSWLRFPACLPDRKDCGWRRVSAINNVRLKFKKLRNLFILQFYCSDLLLFFNILTAD